MKDIEKRCGIEVEPCTQTTQRLVGLMIDTTIGVVCSRGVHSSLNEILSSRTMALLVLELLAGLRVGEATAGGDLHGLEANNMCFITRADYLTSSDDLGQTVEVMVRDSKTGPGRHASFVAMTQGPCAIKGGPIMRQWLKVAGIRTFKEIRGGFKVETPSYYVARLNLWSA